MECKHQFEPWTEHCVKCDQIISSIPKERSAVDKNQMLIKLKLPEIIDPLTIVSGLRNGRESDAYIEGFNRCRDLVESLNQPLVRGMEIDVEEVRKLIGRYCDKYSLLYDGCKGLAEHLKANVHVWLKEIK